MKNRKGGKAEYKMRKELTDNLPVVKILLLGDNAVGKRGIRDRAVTGEFNFPWVPTIGGQYGILKLKTKKQEEPQKLVLWTPPTGFGPHGRYAGALRSIRGLVLVYDVTHGKTFKNLPRWLDDALKFSADFPIAVAGNKIDLRDSVTETINPERGREYAEQVSNELNVPTTFMETSAKTGENIPRLFSELVEMIISKSK